VQDIEHVKLNIGTSAAPMLTATDGADRVAVANLAATFGRFSGYPVLLRRPKIGPRVLKASSVASVSDPSPRRRAFDQAKYAFHEAESGIPALQERPRTRSRPDSVAFIPSNREAS